MPDRHVCVGWNTEHAAHDRKPVRGSRHEGVAIDIGDAKASVERAIGTELVYAYLTVAFTNNEELAIAVRNNLPRAVVSSGQAACEEVERARLSTTALAPNMAAYLIASR